MFGEGSERLHAGHEVRQANVRRRPDHPREGAEHPHPSGGGDVHQGDRGQRFVSDTLIPQVVRFVSEHLHPTGGARSLYGYHSLLWQATCTDFPPRALVVKIRLKKNGVL